MSGNKEGKRVHGVVPIIPIPFDEHEAIDEPALRRLVDFAVTCGVEAICLPAYGSEFYKLSEEERTYVVKVAVEQARGRLLVIGQSNHFSSRVALLLAQANVRAGADLISIALPRLFALSEEDLLDYVKPILNGVTVPCLVQDFNPGGMTIGVEFAVRLQKTCPNFRYLKLEEPLLTRKVVAIREATRGEIGILEGWGGLYMMELIPHGICGVMPGVAMADLLNRVFALREEGRTQEAFEVFEVVLPQIVYSLQNLEVYLYCEKRLLEARGVLRNARCRKAGYAPDAYAVGYVEELNERILQAVETSRLAGGIKKG